MSRRAAVTAIVVTLTLLGAAALADTVLRARVEAGVAAELERDLGTAGADVTIAGFPFLTQVVSGSLDEIDVRAPSADLGGIRLDGVEAVLRGVSTGTPRTAASMQLRGSLDPTSLAAVLPPGVTVTVDGDRLLVSVDVAGVPLQATVTPTAAGRSVALEVVGLTAGGVSIDPGALPFGLGDVLRGLSIPLDALPTGVQLTSVTVVAGRVQVVAEGTDVVLEPVAAGATAPTSGVGPGG